MPELRAAVELVGRQSNRDDAAVTTRCRRAGLWLAVRPFVIPTFNEAAAIAGVIPNSPATSARGDRGGRGSTDGTQEIARAAGAPGSSTPGRGYGRACQAGAEAARACAVIAFLDGDGADRGDLLALIAGPVLAGTHDFVLASRTRGRARIRVDALASGAGRAIAGWGMGRCMGFATATCVRTGRSGATRCGGWTCGK